MANWGSAWEGETVGLQLALPTNHCTGQAPLGHAAQWLTGLGIQAAFSMTAQYRTCLGISGGTAGPVVTALRLCFYGRPSALLAEQACGSAAHMGTEDEGVLTRSPA